MFIPQHGISGDVILTRSNITDIPRYNVTASGAIPKPRDQFCTTVSSAPDDSSFNIMMYGGHDLLANATYDDIYILSIPSFQWINVTNNAVNPESNLFSNGGRSEHTCNLYADRYMVVLGGNVGIGSPPLNGKTCNCSYPAIRVLDTSNFTWMQQWSNTLEPYTVPKPVYSLIGGGYVI